MGGYTGKILRINLTDGKIRREPLKMDLARKYLSGRGLAGKMYADEVTADVDALSPKNKLFFATGVLAGTNFPTSGRWTTVTKSPYDGKIASPNFGGSWGTQLKFAGYDMLVLEGKAKRPVYLAIQDDLVKIEDAAHIWGLDALAARDNLKREIGDNLAKVLTIGPAGERLSLLAVVINDLDRAAGRSGVGAVIGSKNVKAIIARGTGKIEIANSSEMKRILKESLEKTGGSKINAHTGKTQLSQGETCYRCPIHCGRFSKEEAESADFDNNERKAKQEANDLCNKLGLDKIAVNATIAMGIKLVQRGYIKTEELEGIPLEPGSFQGRLEWIHKIAYAEGLGAKMALGAYHFAELYGTPELCKIGNAVKNQRQKGSCVSKHRSSLDQAYKAVIDALGLCLFTSTILALSDYTGIINAVTGCKYTGEEILTCGERICQNERLFNLGAGHTDADDPLTSGKSIKHA